MNEDVTIISVFARDLDYLQANITITRQFNPGSEHRWILVNASSVDDTRSEVPGEQIEWYKGVNEKYIRKTLLKPASQSQGLSVNWGIKNSKTRFVCIMDPDFIVHYPNWLSELTQYMDTAGVGIIGTPYSPQWGDKAHTLCGHFMIIDTQRIPKTLIAYQPSLKEFANTELRKGFGWWLLRRIPFLKYRAALNSRYDCGCQIEERFGDQIEYLTAMIDVRQGGLHNTWLNRFIDQFLPPQWRTLRSKVPYLEVRRFESMMEETKEHFSRLEQYSWKGFPFSIHFRKYGYGVSRELNKALAETANQYINLFYSAHQGLL